MTRYVLKRFAGLLATLVAASILTFLMLELVPGDPVSQLLGDGNVDPAVAASLRELYGLNEPVWGQYLSWVTGVLQGDFGYSLASQIPVADMLWERVPRTIVLLVGGVAVGLAIAVPAGLIGARCAGRWPDAVVTSVVTFLLSMPAFWLGMLLILLVAVALRWVPVAGYVDISEDFWGGLRSLILPWVTIGLSLSAFVARVLRSSLLEVLDQDYIRTARARGLGEWRLTIDHALKNASIPAVTVVGLEIGYLMGGAIVVERVFAYPGVGSLIISGLTTRDYTVVQIAILFYAVAFAVVNLLTDLLYGFLDPRVRVAR
jgi:peptide/nickel transport system permease protein